MTGLRGPEDDMRDADGPQLRRLVAAEREQVLVDAAAAMGYVREEAEATITILEANGLLADFDVAMDLARFVRIPLEDAAWAVVGGDRRLRRLGLSEATLRSEVAGMAEAYTTTFYGSMDVREAQGHTFSKVLTGALERWFGKR